MRKTYLSFEKLLIFIIKKTVKVNNNIKQKKKICQQKYL